ncbi:MAG: SMP-30/gluconolactonase/LRE family protein [Vicinamibacteria bacterium]
MKSASPFITGVCPPHAVAGGRLEVRGRGFDPTLAHAHRVFFGDARAQVTRVSSDSISVVVPQSGGRVPVRVELNGAVSEQFTASLALTIAEQLHPVSNPVFNREGNLFVTFSGSRGQKVPVSVFRIDPKGQVKPFLSEVLNPTGLAFDREGYLYISSRQEGAVYRVSPEREVEQVADELGVATGLAFDPEGILYVGDRQGTIYRVERNGEPRSFCQLPPSIAAYHLAFHPGGDLFVTGPSLSSIDSVYRIRPDATVEIFCTGFGRPQGLAFDADQNLYVTEALAGDSGVYRVSPDGKPSCFISAPPLVGLAFDGKGGLALAGTSSVFHLDVGISGQPLF